MREKILLILFIMLPFSMAADCFTYPIDLIKNGKEACNSERGLECVDGIAVRVNGVDVSYLDSNGIYAEYAFKIHLTAPRDVLSGFVLYGFGDYTKISASTSYSVRMEGEKKDYRFRLEPSFDRTDDIEIEVKGEDMVLENLKLEIWATPECSVRSGDVIYRDEAIFIDKIFSPAKLSYSLYADIDGNTVLFADAEPYDEEYGIVVQPSYFVEGRTYITENAGPLEMFVVSKYSSETINLTISDLTFIDEKRTPVVKIGGEEHDGSDIDIKGGVKTLTLTAPEGHTVIYKVAPQNAIVEAQALSADNLEDYTDSGVQTHTLTIDRPCVLSYASRHAVTGQVSAPATINFVNSSTTAISELHAAEAVEYDLQGRRCAVGAKGVIIRVDSHGVRKIRR